MGGPFETTRREFAKRAAAVLAAPALLRPSWAWAGAAGSAAEPWSELGRLTLKAQQLGLSVPRMSLGPESLSGDYTSTMPAVVDFIDSIDTGLADAGTGATPEQEALREEASDLLGKVLTAEKMPREVSPETTGPSASATIKPPKYEDVADSYRKLFDSCVIKDAKRTELNWYMSKLTDEARRKAYQAVEDDICVPWYFVGIIHGMECGFDLKKHLHNGDPLKYKTVQVPSGRPVVWNPPTDWHSSAVDALRYDKFADQTDWQLTRILYRWEAYNGWRSRLLHGINTPYLWSFSNHYSRGKFVADNVWDSNAVSQQCGAAVMLKALVESGALAPPV